MLRGLSIATDLERDAGPQRHLEERRRHQREQPIAAEAGEAQPFGQDLDGQRRVKTTHNYLLGSDRKCKTATYRSEYVRK